MWSYHTIEVRNTYFCVWHNFWSFLAAAELQAAQWAKILNNSAGCFWLALPNFEQQPLHRQQTSNPISHIIYFTFQALASISVYRDST